MASSTSIATSCDSYISFRQRSKETLLELDTELGLEMLCADEDLVLDDVLFSLHNVRLLFLR